MISVSGISIPTAFIAATPMAACPHTAAELDFGGIARCRTVNASVRVTGDELFASDGNVPVNRLLEYGQWLAAERERPEPPMGVSVDQYRRWLDLCWAGWKGSDLG